MMTRTQITLDPELQRRARERATTLGISLTEYIRRLLARDLEQTQQPVDPALVFDLGSSGNADIARDKDVLIGEAVAAANHSRGMHS
jgi:antitoxin component of RelBE/YafQ-DinJ toxin-antitoxin module